MQAFHFDTVDSTNEAAKRLIGDGRIRDSAYIVAREQTAGKGTQGRSWLSPRDAGLYMSVVHAGGPLSAIPTGTVYALSAGVACVEALREDFDLPVWIKPVNDLFVEGRKLGGILIETLAQNGAITALITGVGVNVRRACRALPESGVEPISLEDVIPPERVQLFDLASFVERLVERVSQWHGLVMAGDRPGVERAWQRLVLPEFHPQAV